MILCIDNNPIDSHKPLGKNTPLTCQKTLTTGVKVLQQSLFILLCLLLTNKLSANTITQVQAQGIGCQPGTVSHHVADGGDAVTFIYSDFFAEVVEGFNRDHQLPTND